MKNKRVYLEDSGEIERIFRDDIREKKVTGYGAYSRKGKGVRHGVSGGIRFASDTMTGKEKKAYKGARRVITHDLNGFMPKHAFYQLDEDLQKQRLEHWRKEHTNTEIQKNCGFGKKELYELVNKFDISKKGFNVGPRRKQEEVSISDLEKMKNDPKQVGTIEKFKSLPVHQRDVLSIHWHEMNWSANDISALIEGCIPNHIHQDSWAARNRKEKREAKEKQIQENLKSKDTPPPTQQVAKFQEQKDPQKSIAVSSVPTLMTDEWGQLVLHHKAKEELIFEKEKLSMQKNIDDLKSQIRNMEAEAETMANVIAAAPQAPPQIKGFYLTHNGEFTATDIGKRLKNVIDIVHGTNAKYELKLELIEATKPKNTDSTHDVQAVTLADSFQALAQGLKKIVGTTEPKIINSNYQSCIICDLLLDDDSMRADNLICHDCLDKEKHKSR